MVVNVLNNPDGFPWARKSVWDILKGGNILNSEGSECTESLESLQTMIVIGIYFGAFNFIHILKHLNSKKN